MQRIPPELTANARRLRTEATVQERRLWAALRGRRPRFTRQLVIDGYIIDLACRRLKLAIELDGGQHALRVEQDAVRTEKLETLGWTVLRFWNSELDESLEGVVAAIE